MRWMAPVPDRTRVYLAGGFQPSKIYEVVYKGTESAGSRRRDPAAVRDVIAHLKHAVCRSLVDSGRLHFGRAIAFGISDRVAAS